MIELLALITIIAWPVVPLFWIPVHFFYSFFRRLGVFTYIMSLLTWLPLAYIIYLNRGFFLHLRINLPVMLNILGVILIISGTLVHIWTAKLLGLLGLMGLPEISTVEKGRLVTGGAFSYVRHPTYLSHTMIFLGVFLLTEVIAVGIVTFLDLIIVNILIIPLEEKELLSRFGREYEIYKRRVPGFFPWLKGVA